jgi:hypothetical protein
MERVHAQGQAAGLCHYEAGDEFFGPILAASQQRIPFEKKWKKG